MNLVDIHNMSNIVQSDHVIVDHDFEYNIYKDKYVNIKEFSKGKVISIDKNKRTIDVYFDDDSHYSNLPFSRFRKRQDLKYEDALKIIKKYRSGHHCKSEYEFQFDIKMKKTLRIDSGASDGLKDDQVDEIIKESLNRTLESFTNQNFYEYCPLSFFEWIGGFHIAGRSSGYLILTDYLKGYEYSEDELEEKEKKEIIQKAYDLEMINKLKNHYQDLFYQEISDPEFWKEQKNLLKEWDSI